MIDFLTFQTFITPSLLILMYYIGALVIPLFAWYLTIWLKNKYYSHLSTTTQNRLNNTQRFFTYTLVLVCILFMEILWRMMFEFFIAYFDMHDALMKQKVGR